MTGHANMRPPPRRAACRRQALRSRNRSRGQAMTEVAICAAFILVPLFLIIPTFGKFIDMKQTAVQAARYEAAGARSGRFACEALLSSAGSGRRVIVYFLWPSSGLTSIRPSSTARSTLPERR